MSLIPWRKLQAGLSGNSIKDTQAVIQQVVNNTVVEQQEMYHASSIVWGLTRYAVGSEVTTGSDATQAITPYYFAVSERGYRGFYRQAIDPDTALSTGDGKSYFTIPDVFDGMILVDADVAVYTASTSGLPSIALYNVTLSHDMLSTNITLDVNEKNSFTAATQPVINTSYDNVATGDIIRVDVDAAGTGTKGLDIILAFRTPG